MLHGNQFLSHGGPAGSCACSWNTKKHALTGGGEPLALVIIEDITEISTLKSIIPMCMQCRKIRNDEQYWQTVEQYFHEHIGVDFSHGICPDCIDKFRRS
jgi:hypothetical protein